ncbi:hypothetical protein [Spongorhabdus nitratireducens]
MPRLFGCYFLFSSLLSSSAIAATDGNSGQVYPSAGTAWVLPGIHEAPTDPSTRADFPDGESVFQWELKHADRSLGDGYDPERDIPIPVIGYMYNQKLEFNSGRYELELRDRMESNGMDYEDAFLHFSEDTVLVENDPYSGSKTALNQVPPVAGWWPAGTNSGGKLIWHKAPYDLPAWDGYESEGGLVIFMTEKFDQLNLTLSQPATGGQIEVLYPSSVTSAGLASGWKSVPVSDGTEGLSYSGNIRWEPPADWARAATYHPSSRTGSDFGKRAIREGGKFYLIKVVWKAGAVDIPPRLANVQLRSWLPRIGLNGAGKHLRKVPGWDPVNDPDKNYYVDDEEFERLQNPHATARFPYEARVVPLGRMWGSHSSWCRTNLFNRQVRTETVDLLIEGWEQRNWQGAYNDDMFKLLGPRQFEVVSGGSLIEYDGRVQDDETITAYTRAMAKLLRQLQRRKIDGQPVDVAGNISDINVYEDEEYHLFITALNVFLREAYLLPAMGLSGYTGINRLWDTFALAHAGRQSIIMSAIRQKTNVQLFGNTQDSWERDIETGLAQFYLINVPGWTWFQQWNQSFIYGSGNTSSANYFKAGVPRNMAYQPSAMLSIDIGKPLQVAPSDYELMSYMMPIRGVTNYHIIGDSGDSVLSGPSLPGQQVNVIPSYIYFLQRSPEEVVTGGPADAVLARNYTKGLVLYRTDFLGNSAAFFETSSGAIPLPQPYRRVLPDGTLGPVINSIELSGYEGAILVSP